MNRTIGKYEIRAAGMQTPEVETIAAVIGSTGTKRYTDGAAIVLDTRLAAAKRYYLGE